MTSIINKTLDIKSNFSEVKSPLTILLIENNPEDATAIKKMLTHTDMRFSVTFANSLHQGLRHLEANQFDIILLEFDLPDSLGIEALRRVNKAASNTPIILLAKSSDANLMVAAIKEGALDLLDKGKIEKELLLRSIQFALIRKQIQKGLLSDSEQFKGLIERSPNGVILINHEKQIIFTNTAFVHILGAIDKMNVLQRSFMDYVHPSYLQYVLNWLTKLQTTGGSSSPIEIILIKNDVTPINVEITGNYFFRESSGHTEIIVNDITERKKTETDLQYLVQSDSLTGLINHNFLDDHIKHAISEANRRKCHIAILCGDLNHFKLINETFGHKVGDLLLQAVVQRLKKSAHEHDIILMLGNDEFSVILQNVENLDTIHQLLKKFHDVFTQPFFINNQELFTTASIGISIYPENGGDSQTLLKHADLALFHAKQQGRNNYQFFMPAMSRHIQEQADIMHDLQHALDNKEFLLFYQPVVNVKKNELVSIEALLRWNRAKKGILLPQDFLSFAEETGLITKIGEWVIESVCKQNLAWQKQGIDLLRISINLSTRQFHIGANLINTISSILKTTKLPAHCLEFEMSEIVTMLDIGGDILHELKKMGISLTIDDFGASYLGNHLNWDVKKGNATINNIKLGVYTNYFINDFFLNATLTGGINWSEAKRNIQLIGIGFAALTALPVDILDINRIAHSQQLGGNLGIHLSGFKSLQFHDWNVGALAKLSYFYFNESAFNEKEAQSLDLHVNTFSTQTLRTELAMQLSKEIITRKGLVIKSDVQVGWAHYVPLDKHVISAALLALGGRFAVHGYHPNKNTGLVSAGLMSFATKNLWLSGRYEAELSHGFNAQMFSLIATYFMNF